VNSQISDVNKDINPTQTAGPNPPVPSLLLSEGTILIPMAGLFPGKEILTMSTPVQFPNDGNPENPVPVQLLAKWIRPNPMPAQLPAEWTPPIPITDQLSADGTPSQYL